MGEANAYLGALGDCDSPCKSTRQLRDELRGATRSSVRREKGDLYNFLSVRMAEEEMVVLDLPGIQKTGSRKSDSLTDGTHEETEADRKAMMKLAKKLVKAKQRREIEPISESEEEEMQDVKCPTTAAVNVGASAKALKAHMESRNGKHPELAQQDLKQSRRIITPQALQQWWLERVQLSASESSKVGRTGITTFKRQSRGSGNGREQMPVQMQPDIQRVVALKKSVTMEFDSSYGIGSSQDPKDDGGSERHRVDPRNSKRTVSGGQLKNGLDIAASPMRQHDIFEDRYTRRAHQHSPVSAQESNSLAAGGMFEVQGRTFEVSNRSKSNPRMQQSFTAARNARLEPTRSASRESLASGSAKSLQDMYDSMDSRQPTLQLPPLPGANPPPLLHLVQPSPSDDLGMHMYNGGMQNNSPVVIQSMHQLQREYSRKKPLVHRSRSGGTGARPLVMPGGV